MCRIVSLVFVPLFVFSAAVLAAEELVLDPNLPIICSEWKGNQVRAQCDDGTKVCLVAIDSLLKDGKPSNMGLRGLKVCDNDLQYLAAMSVRGFAIKTAAHESSWGYKRDELGQLYQTHFDLRRRFFVGLNDMMHFGTFDQTLAIEIGGEYESYDRYENHRNRYRFLEGSLSINPLEINGVLFQYDAGKKSDKPVLWFTTFIGAPERYDLNIDLGPGFFLLRVATRTVDDDPEILLDIGQLHLNWEIFQGAQLEDYLALKIGGGVGLRPSSDGFAKSNIYFYPEVALRFAWTIDHRGLTSLRGEARARIGFETTDNRKWLEINAYTSLERIVLAVADQPISVFLKPEITYHRLIESERDAFDFRLFVGGRMSFFTPPTRRPTKLTTDSR